jgi:hypothetical protein
LTRQAIGALGAVFVLACHAAAPPGPEAACAGACETRAKQCDDRQCARGCNFVIDRLAENEGDQVLACVASAGASCDDRTWARCATRIGPHADGGPPAPPPPKDFEDE